MKILFMEISFKLDEISLLFIFDGVVVIFVFYRFFTAFHADVKNPKSTSQDNTLPETIAVVLLALVNLGVMLYDYYFNQN